MKITAWRIVQARHLPGAFIGVGARDFPGRWNERGIPVVYMAGSLSLAAMEMLVHLGHADMLNLYLSIPVRFDESLCRRLASSDLPPDWAAYPVRRLHVHLGPNGPQTDYRPYWRYRARLSPSRPFLFSIHDTRISLR
ncbi:MAG TPA: RES domain-containing protein [bacterium]|nr:RES domain-containing protein [bacterium]